MCVCVLCVYLCRQCVSIDPQSSSTFWKKICQMGIHTFTQTKNMVLIQCGHHSMNRIPPLQHHHMFSFMTKSRMFNYPLLPPQHSCIVYSHSRWYRSFQFLCTETTLVCPFTKDGRWSLHPSLLHNISRTLTSLKDNKCVLFLFFFHSHTTQLGKVHKSTCVV